MHPIKIHVEVTWTMLTMLTEVLARVRAAEVTLVVTNDEWMPGIDWLLLSVEGTPPAVLAWLLTDYGAELDEALSYLVTSRDHADPARV